MGHRYGAALLSHADEPRFYPVRWATSHATATGPPPEPPKDEDPIRVYMNTERAAAFVVVDGNPAYCRDASTVSGFKFNAICDISLGDIRNAEPEGGRHVVSAIEVCRRAPDTRSVGTRSASSSRRFTSCNTRRPIRSR